MLTHHPSCLIRRRDRANLQYIYEVIPGLSVVPTRTTFFPAGRNTTSRSWRNRSRSLIAAGPVVVQLSSESRRATHHMAVAQCASQGGDRRAAHVAARECEPKSLPGSVRPGSHRTRSSAKGSDPCRRPEARSPSRARHRRRSRARRETRECVHAKCFRCCIRITPRSNCIRPPFANETLVLPRIGLLAGVLPQRCCSKEKQAERTRIASV